MRQNRPINYEVISSFLATNDPETVRRGYCIESPSGDGILSQTIRHGNPETLREVMRKLYLCTKDPQHRFLRARIFESVSMVGYSLLDEAISTGNPHIIDMIFTATHGTVTTQKFREILSSVAARNLENVQSRNGFTLIDTALHTAQNHSRGEEIVSKTLGYLKTGMKEDYSSYIQSFSAGKIGSFIRDAIRTQNVAIFKQICEEMKFFPYFNGILNPTIAVNTPMHAYYETYGLEAGRTDMLEAIETLYRERFGERTSAILTHLETHQNRYGNTPRMMGNKSGLPREAGTDGPEDTTVTRYISSRKPPSRPLDQLGLLESVQKEPVQSTSQPVQPPQKAKAAIVGASAQAKVPIPPAAALMSARMRVHQRPTTSPHPDHRR